jgi:hypothetical protein
MRVQGAAGKAKFVAPAFYAFMALLLLVFGIRSQSWADNLLVYMGLGFLVFAVVLFVANLRAFGKAKRPDET